jgi:hypothetical protein
LKAKLDGKLVISIKQAMEMTGDITTFHLLNFSNFAKYNYDHIDKDKQPIVVWSIDGKQKSNHYKRIEGHKCDIAIQLKNTSKKATSTVVSKRWDNFLEFRHGNTN